MLTVAVRTVYLEAWLLVAMGLAFRIAPVLERHPARWRRRLLSSVPVLLGLVVLQAGWIFGGDWIKQSREDGRPLPPADSPNVLLIVLDTVRADHLSLYGVSDVRRPPIWINSPSVGSASTRLEPRRRGPSHRTRTCSQGDGLMS